MISGRLYVSGGTSQKWYCVLCVHCSRGHVMSLCPITSDIDFGHLVNQASLVEEFSYL